VVVRVPLIIGLFTVQVMRYDEINKASMLYTVYHFVEVSHCLLKFTFASIDYYTYLLFSVSCTIPKSLYLMGELIAFCASNTVLSVLSCFSLIIKNNLLLGNFTSKDR
jgi:hypothetical protein